MATVLTVRIVNDFLLHLWSIENACRPNGSQGASSQGLTAIEKAPSTILEHQALKSNSSLCFAKEGNCASSVLPVVHRSLEAERLKKT
jgi:hypothetical protein